MSASPLRPVIPAAVPLRTESANEPVEVSWALRQVGQPAVDGGLRVGGDELAAVVGPRRRRGLRMADPVQPNRGPGNGRGAEEVATGNGSQWVAHGAP